MIAFAKKKKFLLLTCIFVHILYLLQMTNSVLSNETVLATCYYKFKSFYIFTRAKENKIT